MAGRRSGDGIATSANGRKCRGGVWDNGQLVKEVQLILEKSSSTSSLYPSACPRPRPRAGAAAALTRAAVGRLGNYMVQVRLLCEDARLMSLVRKCKRARRRAVDSPARADNASVRHVRQEGCGSG